MSKARWRAEAIFLDGRERGERGGLRELPHWLLDDPHEGRKALWFSGYDTGHRKRERGTDASNSPEDP